MGIFSRKQNRRTSEQVDDAPPHIPKNTRRSSGSIMMTARKGMKQLTKFVSKKNKKRAFAVLVAVALAAASLAKVNPEAAKKVVDIFNPKKTEISPPPEQEEGKQEEWKQEDWENEDAYEISVGTNGTGKIQIKNEEDFEKCREAIWHKKFVKIESNDGHTTYMVSSSTDDIVQNKSVKKFTVNLKDSKNEKKTLIVTSQRRYIYFTFK